MSKSKKKFLFIFSLVVMSGVCLPLVAAESDDVRTWSPNSSMQPSEGVQYYGSESVQEVTHTNVTTDDTRKSKTAEVKENTEFNTTTSVRVLGNMGSGSAAKIYSAEELASKTGAPSEKKGVVVTPAGKSVQFTTAGTEVIDPPVRAKPEYYRVEPTPQEESEEETATPGSEENADSSNRPRVFVS